MSTNLSAFLTPKQQVFCNEYLVDMNATRAALRAGYSASTALNGQLMQMRKIKLYLQQHMAAATAKAEFTHERVLRELGKIAFGSMTDYFDEQGSLKPMQEITADAKAALWSVTVSEGGEGAKPGKGLVKLRMYNKLAALDKIAKHIGFYEAENAPAKQYVYLDKDDMTEDDRFDDEDIDEEDDNYDDEEDGHEDRFLREQDTYGTAQPTYENAAPRPAVLAEPEVVSKRITDEEREILTKQMPTLAVPGFVTNGYTYAEIKAHEARVKEIKLRMKLYGLVV
jgi:hypothetical protein